MKRLFPITCLAVLSVFAAPGCAAPPVAAGDAPRQGKDAPQAEIFDAQKASLELDQIEPRVDPPPRGVELPPLPQRAAEPIAASSALISQQRYTEAALELERALRYAGSGHPEIHAHLAMLHWQAGNLERARTSAQQTVEGNPQSVIGHYILGRTLAASGDRAGALKELRTAMLCRDFSADLEVAALIHFHVAEMLSAEGYLTAAIKQYEAFGQKAAQATPTPKGELASLLATRRGSVNQAKADMLEKLGRNAEAAQVLRPIAESSPNDIAVQLRYARLLLAADQTAQAASALANLSTDNEQVLDLLIEIRKKAGQSEKIIEDLETRVKANPDSAQLVDRLATALVEANQESKAASVLSEFLQRHPENDLVRKTQLGLLIRTSQWSEALKLTAENVRNNPASEKDIASILEAVRTAPESVDAIIASAQTEPRDALHLFLVGKVAAEAGRWDQAERILRDSLGLEPKLAPARAALAELLIRRCELEEARKIAARGETEAADDPRIERVLGLIYDRLDDTDRADLHYRTAIQLDRADTRSMYALAGIYRRAKKPLQAQRQLRTLLEVDPANEQARELLALLFLEEGKRDAALQEYQALAKSSQKPTTKARCRIVLDPSLRGNAPEQRKVLHEAIEAGGPDPPTLIAIAETYEDTDLAKAREYYAQAVSIDPDDEEARLGVLRMDQYQLRFDQVAAGLEEMLRCRPNRHGWHRMLVGMYSLLEKFDLAVGLASREEARPELDDAVRAKYREVMIESLNEAGRSEEAREKLEAWAAQDGEGKEWTQRLGLEHARQRRFRDAADVYISLLDLAPDNRTIRDRLLDALQQSDQHTRAEQFLVRWFAEDPQNDRLVVALAHVIARSGRVDDGLDLLNTWIQRTGRRELFQDMIVSELAAAGRHEDAAQVLGELIDEIVTVIRHGGDAGRIPGGDQLTEERRARRPNEPFVIERLQERLELLRLRLVSVLGNAQDFRDAQALLDQLMQASPEPEMRRRLLYQQATLSRLKGDVEEADSAMEQVLSLGPPDESLSNDLAYAWIDRGVRLDEADKLIRFALGRMPRQAAYLDTYAWLLYKQGDFEGAKVWLLRANRVRGGDDPVIHDHLGDTYWRLGDRDQAEARWKTAVGLLQNKSAAQLSNDDERRVKKTTQQKIDDAAAGKSPVVAPLGGEPPAGKDSH